MVDIQLNHITRLQDAGIIIPEYENMKAKIQWNFVLSNRRYRMVRNLVKKNPRKMFLDFEMNRKNVVLLTNSFP